MECQASDSKKIFKVFDASKRKKSRKKRDNFDESISLGTEDSKSLIQQANSHGTKSAKASLQDITAGGEQISSGRYTPKRESSPSVSPSPDRTNRAPRSPRRHRRPHRDDLSLALNAGVVSSPRSGSPQQVGDGLTDSMPVDQDSFIYAFLEDAIKKDKRKHRRHRGETHSSRDRNRDHDDRSRDIDRDRDGDYERPRTRDLDVARARDRDRDETSTVRGRHRHHHRRRDEPSREHESEKPVKEKSQPPVFDQTALFETFAKLCSTITDKTSSQARPPDIDLTRNQSHKSLQCEVVSKNEACDADQRPERLRSREGSQEVVDRSNTRVRSLEDIHGSRGRIRSPARPPSDRKDKFYPYEKPLPKYTSKTEVVPSRTRVVEEDRYRDYPTLPTRSCMDRMYRRDYREYEERRDPMRERRSYDDDRRRFFEEERRRCCEKTSRSFDPHRELHEEERLRRSTRSDTRKKRYEDVRERRYDDRRDKYYEEREREYRERHGGIVASKDRRRRRTPDRCERNSVVSPDDDYKERDGYYAKERDGCSERERDSGLSVADGETSIVSGKSNYLRVVKQGIAEQREAMEKMMKLWKELMRCFKSISQSPVQDKAAQDSAASVQESAAAQLRLWRECMRRYETVARDVGDTDARLMDEIAKQRSEMAEMANMWQECLQRYRDMSNDFNSLKQQLANETPPRSQPSPRLQPAPASYPEGEGLPPAPYRMPPAYPSPPPHPLPPAMAHMGGYAGSPLRSRASAPPPAWWWMSELAAPPAARRRSSPDSRRSTSHSRERRHRHKDRERDDSRYKKSAKPNATHSEHRHRKR